MNPATKPTNEVSHAAELELWEETLEVTPDELGCLLIFGAFG